MKEFEYTGLLELSLIIEAETKEEADRQISTYSAEGWKRDAEIVGISDVELIAETNVK